MARNQQFYPPLFKFRFFNYQFFICLGVLDRGGNAPQIACVSNADADEKADGFGGLFEVLKMCMQNTFGVYSKFYLFNALNKRRPMGC
jgi:hypothetical protein